MDPDKEINIRIEMAQKAFVKYSSMLKNRNVSTYNKLRLMECYELT